MRRTLLTVALATCSLFAMGGIAVAGDVPGGGDVPGVPPAFAPPTPAPVVDNDSAGAFAKLYASQHAGQFLNQSDRRRVRVIDTQSSCLTAPFLLTRFGCVFTLKALVISRNRGWDQWGHGDSRGHSRYVKHGQRGHGRDRHQRFRVRAFGCLGFLRIDGGPTATPTVQVVNVECRRLPREDRDVDETVTAPV